MSQAPPPQPYDGRADARRLLRTVRSGSLATVAGDGTPFASLVTVATLVDGHPLLLLSGLAAHTRHLDADGRCALLLAALGKGDPLAHPRLTLTGRAVRLGGEGAAEARARFLARQPKAALYADFPDFAFWRLDPAAGHLNGGFARAARIEPGDMLSDGAGELAAIERGAVAHMNADHRDALRLYARVLAGAGDGDWTASGLDPDGIDLLCGDRVARVDFDAPVHSAGALRACLKALADAARAAEGSPGP